MLFDAEEETLDWIFGITPRPLSKLLTEENLFKVWLISTDPKTINPTDLEASCRAAKKRKASAAPAPKCGWPEAILGQPMLIHHVDHFIEVIREVRRLSKEAEEKAVQATQRMDDAQLSRLKVEDKNRSLKEKVKQLQFKLTKAKAWLLGKKKVGKARVEVATIEAVKIFHSSIEFRNIKAEFASTSYLQRIEDMKEKIRRNFPNLNLDLLESEGEEAEEVEGQKVQMEDLFSPTHDDLVAGDVTSAPPPTIIVLSDQVEVGKSGAPDGA
ncbi:hypothetical protein COCNU_scaffold003598G000010 [Cocos nucifera]|nr:hypothetical protein [Cocos nucifera]